MDKNVADVYKRKDSSVSGAGIVFMGVCMLSMKLALSTTH